MRKRIIILTVALILTAFIALFFYRQHGGREAALITSGIVEGREVNLSSKVPGRITTICCNDGDSIQAGSKAVILESSDLEALVRQAEAGVERSRADVRSATSAVTNARAALRVSEAEIASAEAAVEKALVTRENAAKEMKRVEALYREDLVSQQTFDKAVAIHDISAAELQASRSLLESASAKKNAAVARLNAAVSQLDAARKTVLEAEANLSYHRSRLNDTEITSPISGTVAFRAFEEGETVNPGITVMTIIDMEHLFVRSDIEETKIRGIALNDTAYISIEGAPDNIIEGRVSEVGRYADFATQRDVVRGRQDIRTFRIKIAFQDKTGTLKPGMTVMITFRK